MTKPEPQTTRKPKRPKLDLRTGIRAGLERPIEPVGPRS
jgi:hypothetical protein